MMFTNYSFAITHYCNLSCKDCSHYIKTSDYTFLTIPEYNSIVEKLKNKRISEIEIIGGEPLMHPEFELLMSKIFEDFANSRVILITNGKLLPNLDYKLRSKFHRIYISYYKGFNEKEILSFINEPNVYINHTKFIKLDKVRTLGDRDAKIVSKNCSNKVRRFVGSRLYPCCLAEGIERTYLKKPVHVDLISDQEWEKEFSEINTETACQYCMLSESVLNNKLRNNLYKLKQYFLLNSILAGRNHDWLWRIWRNKKNSVNWINNQP